MRAALSRWVVWLGGEILREGELVIGRRFVLRRMAEAWAEEERKVLEKGRERSVST